MPEREERGNIRHGRETGCHKSGLFPAMEDVVLLIATTRFPFPPRAREEPQSHSLRHVVSSGKGWLNTLLCGVMGTRNNKGRTCLRESKE